MSDDSIAQEELVEALMRRSDGPVVIRPLRSTAADRGWPLQLMSAITFTLVVVASAAIGSGLINSLRQPAASPAGGASVEPTRASTTTIPSPSGTGAAGFATAEAAADAAKQALEGQQFQMLVGVVAPTGWYARWYEQTQTDPMPLVEAVAWVSMYPDATWRVDASEVRDAGPSRPVGDKYVTALVIDFGGWEEQRADIMLRPIGGRWFWSSLLLYRPPPLGASLDTIVGYARLISVTDATITIRFRTVGSRCCSDQSWNDRVVVLRRDDRAIYNGAGGVSAGSLTDSGIAVAADVWVQFRLDTLAPDGSYRLAWLVAMYPQR